MSVVILPAFGYNNSGLKIYILEGCQSMGNNNEKKSRDQFRTRMGFIVACIGSAVGMGNIWMFPYRTGAFGGAAFLIPYFIFVLVLGFSGVLGEIAFGRVMGTGPTGAF